MSSSPPWTTLWPEMQLLNFPMRDRALKVSVRSGIFFCLSLSLFLHIVSIYPFVRTACLFDSKTVVAVQDPLCPPRRETEYEYEGTVIAAGPSFLFAGV
ncbi:unnamed protein product [Periconia digitata]|uniref:Uncharacterized protein n=1 Tax=Periconia digitata TaxID=1303443 RepID=A0A9W4UWW2_9PLEO|nr:unnamed protein product [Periconia digitata]